MASTLGDIERLVHRASLTIGALLAAHTMLETARDALFLEKVPLEHLPWMYLAIAGISAITVMLPARMGKGRSPATTPARLGAGLGIAALGTVAFALVATGEDRRFYYALYLWSGLVGANAVAQFWSTMARIFTLGEAKRVYARIGLGAILGGVAGAALARGLFLVAPARALIVLSAAGFGLAGLLSFWLGRCGAHRLQATDADPGEPSRRSEGGGASPASFREAFGNMYIQRIGAMALASTVTLTLLDYVFKRALVARVAPESLGATLATVALATNFFSAASQTVVVPRMIRVHGAVGSLSVLPALLLVGAMAGTLGPVVALAVAMRLVDGTLRFSLHRTSVELLFVPVADSIRSRAKTLIDVMTQRGGQALASVAILLTPAHVPLRVLTAVLAVGSAAWLVLVRRLRGPHVELFRTMVEEGAFNTQAALPTLDLTSLEVLVGALSSPKDDEVIAAMEVLVDRGKVQLIPTLILYHPSARVVIRALELFVHAKRRDAGVFAWRLVAHENADVRVRAVHAAATLAFDRDRVRACLDDPDTGVRATAMVELWARGLQKPEDIARIASIFGPEGDPRAQRAVLAALATTRAHTLLLAALPLAEHGDLEVRAAIARALQIDPAPEALPELIAMLEHYRTREPARRALVRIGGAALTALTSAIDTAPRGVLVHLPRSISRFAPELAAPILLRLLQTHPDGTVRYKALRGLGRLVANGAKVDVDIAHLMPLFDRNLEQAHEILSWYERLMAVPTRAELRPVHDLLASLLADQLAHALERVLRLIGLTHPGEDWEQIAAALKSKNARLRDSGRELLENAVSGPLGRRLAVLLDEMNKVLEPARTIRVAAERDAHDPSNLRAALEPMLRGSDRTVRAVAGHYAAKMGGAVLS
ncbi:hypothetical protein [Pendulispora albinea]|uniref:MFS transporter n=1 Tax=Pendulispora albinea TaxID=2741071 RepID=A0ABZ2M8U7_9BACT